MPADCCKPLDIDTEYCYGAGDSLITTLNAGFEQPVIATNTWQPVQESLVPGWETDDPSNQIEIWNRQAVDGGGPYEGNQLAELNYLGNTRLFQTLTVPEDAGVVTWAWAHRARNGAGIQTARFLLGDASTPYPGHDIVNEDTGNANFRIWNYNEGTWWKRRGITELVVSLQAVQSINPALGNLVDAVSLTFQAFDRATVLRCCDDSIRYVNTRTGVTLTEAEAATIVNCSTGG